MVEIKFVLINSIYKFNIAVTYCDIQAEQRDNPSLAAAGDAEPDDEPEVKDLRSTKKNQNKEKQVKKKATEVTTNH